MAPQCNYFFQKKKKTCQSFSRFTLHIWEDASKGIYIEEHGTLLILSKDVSNNVPLGIDYSERNGSHAKTVCFTLPECRDYLLGL